MLLLAGIDNRDGHYRSITGTEAPFVHPFLLFCVSGYDNVEDVEQNVLYFFHQWMVPSDAPVRLLCTIDIYGCTTDEEEFDYLQKVLSKDGNAVAPCIPPIAGTIGRLYDGVDRDFCKRVFNDGMVYKVIFISK